MKVYIKNINRDVLRDILFGILCLGHFRLIKVGPPKRVSQSMKSLYNYFMREREKKNERKKERKKEKEREKVTKSVSAYLSLSLSLSLSHSQRYSRAIGVETHFN